jgi:Ca2+-binding EF-hand superfamily protein
MKRIVLLMLGLALAGCASDHPRRHAHVETFHPPIEILQKYDANRDGILTRAELEAGIKADFAAADTNHDGRLDQDETRAENQRRWSEGLSTTSTVVDWNQDGTVDFNEFAGTARSLFAQLDRKNKGQIDLKKLTPKPDQQDTDQDDDTVPDRK